MSIATRLTPLYETVRLRDPKDFRARRNAKQRPWSITGLRYVVYHLYELQGYDVVYIAEGEKDTDRLWAVGLPATTNVGGAGKWRDDYTQQLLAAGCRRVILFPHNDEAGLAHATTVATSCRTVTNDAPPDVTYRVPQARENAADARDRAYTRPTPCLPSSRSSRRSPFETFAIVTDHSAAPILANHSQQDGKQHRHHRPGAYPPSAATSTASTRTDFSVGTG